MGTPTRPVRVPYDVDHNPRSTVLPGRVNPDLSVPIPATHALRIQPTQTASTPAFAWLSDGRCAACQMAVLTILSARVRQCGMTLRGGDGRASASTLWTITRTRHAAAGGRCRPGCAASTSASCDYRRKIVYFRSDAKCDIRVSPGSGWVFK